MADTADITGNVSLEQCWTIGAVSLVGVELGGDLECSRATLRNKGDNALVATGADITGSVRLSNITAIGAVWLHSAKIGGELNCSGATLGKKGGNAQNGDNALTADKADITGNALLTNLTTACGVVSLLDTKIGGNLDCSDATLCNKDGNALLVERAEITGYVFLNGDFSSTGVVSLMGAKIGSALDCSGATLCNKDGDALLVGVADIKGGLLLVALRDNDPRAAARSSARATNFRSTGAVSLEGAKIGGDLAVEGARMIAPTPKADGKAREALIAQRAKIGQALFFRYVHVTGGVDQRGQARRCSSTTLGGSRICRRSRGPVIRW